MIRRIPVIPTLLVLAAVAVMVRLGFWQIDRLHQKEMMLAQYAAASDFAPLAIDAPDLAAPNLGFRKVVIDCAKVNAEQLVAGASLKGDGGWAHAVPCRIRDFEGYKQLAVVIGWSHDLRHAQWSGGRIEGVLVPGNKSGVVLNEVRGGTFGFVHNASYHLVASEPVGGLAANAMPNPNNIPNNHLSYAVQWFLFALTALVIYGLALRKRLAA
jgi:surfeit locus 1 family protein